jgi:hypothetical protein
MKVAELHNGGTLEFPDETSDDAIDQAVQLHLADSLSKQDDEEEARKKEHQDRLKVIESEKEQRLMREDSDRRYKLQRDEQFRKEDLEREAFKFTHETSERRYDRDRHDQHRAEDKQEKAADRQADAARHAHRDELIFGIQQQLNSIAQAVGSLETAKEEIKLLSDNIELFGSKIESAIAAAVERLTAPKKLIVDSRGRPVGVKMSEDNG